MERLGFSARAYSSILKVSKIIVNLYDTESIKEEHVTKAIHYRSLYRNNWVLDNTLKFIILLY